MILLVHMIFGAATGYLIYSTTSNLYLAIIVALLSHYFLDLFPHIEYSIENIKHNKWKSALPDMIKVFIDFNLAFFLIFLLKGNSRIYIFAFTSTIPDGLTIISNILPNRLLSIHNNIHTEKIHYLTKQKKFPMFWRVFSQALAFVIGIIILSLY